MTNPTVTVLNSFAALRSEMAQGSASRESAESVDVFYTLEWFDNLATHGLVSTPDAEIESPAHPYLLLANDPARGRWTCLPLLAGKQLTGLSNYYSSLLGPVHWHSNTSQVTDLSADQAVWAAMATHLHQAKADQQRGLASARSAINRFKARRGHCRLCGGV